jgi:hypothetical protein
LIVWCFENRRRSGGTYPQESSARNQIAQSRWLAQRLQVQAVSQRGPAHASLQGLVLFGRLSHHASPSSGARRKLEWRTPGSRFAVTCLAGGDGPPSECNRGGQLTHSPIEIDPSAAVAHPCILTAQMGSREKGPIADAASPMSIAVCTLGPRDSGYLHLLGKIPQLSSQFGGKWWVARGWPARIPWTGRFRCELCGCEAILSHPLQVK